MGAQVNGDRRCDPDTETESSVDSTETPLPKWGDYLHNIKHSMSRRGNCDENAVAESFFNLLKRERIRRRTCKTREQARQDVRA